MKHPLLLPHLLLVLLLTLWDDNPPLPTAYALQGTRLHGINYSLRIGPDWTSGADRCKSYDRIVDELTKLKDITDNVRVYSMTDCDTASILLSATQQVGDLGLWLGLWVGPDQLGFEEERGRLLELLNDAERDVSNVIGIHVSSEAIMREDVTVEQAIAMRDIIKADLDELGTLTDIPVTVTDITGIYRRHTELIEVDPIAITANKFPFWESKSININGDGPGNKPDYPSAAEYFEKGFKYIEERVGDRQVIITETGWADAGVSKNANVASPAAMAKWMRDFVCLAEAKGWQYFWFIAFDSDWRRVNEQKPDHVEGHFGIFDEEGNMKPHMRDLVIDCSQPYYDIDPDATPSPTTQLPTAFPTTAAPTNEPTGSPTKSTDAPTRTLTEDPTEAPTDAPTKIPTDDPTEAPTHAPTEPPTDVPTKAPTVAPTKATADAPTRMPKSATKTPTIPPTDSPTMSPFHAPSSNPSLVEAAPAAIQSLVETSSAPALVWLPNAAVLLTCFLALL